MDWSVVLLFVPLLLLVLVAIRLGWQRCAGAGRSAGAWPARSLPSPLAAVPRPGGTGWSWQCWDS